MSKTPKTDKLWRDNFPACLKLSPINRCVFFFELLEKMRDLSREMESDFSKAKEDAARLAWLVNTNGTFEFQHRSIHINYDLSREGIDELMKQVK